MQHRQQHHRHQPDQSPSTPPASSLMNEYVDKEAGVAQYLPAVAVSTNRATTPGSASSASSSSASSESYGPVVASGLSGPQNGLKIESGGSGMSAGEISTLPKKTSQYRGVCFHKASRLWRARIDSKRRRVHVGYFHREVDAARAYDRVSLELNGIESGIFNFPKEAEVLEVELRNGTTKPVLQVTTTSTYTVNKKKVVSSFAPKTKTEADSTGMVSFDDLPGSATMADILTSGKNIKRRRTVETPAGGSEIVQKPVQMPVFPPHHPGALMPPGMVVPPGFLPPPTGNLYGPVMNPVLFPPPFPLPQWRPMMPMMPLTTEQMQMQIHMMQMELQRHQHHQAAIINSQQQQQQQTGQQQSPPAAPPPPQQLQPQQSKTGASPAASPAAPPPSHSGNDPEISLWYLQQRQHQQQQQQQLQLYR